VKKELIALLAAAAMIAVALPALDYHVGPWLNPVVLPGEVEAAKWAHGTAGLYLADIFGGELVMGFAGKPSLVGGDWAANARAPEQMNDMHEFYLTDSADKAVGIWQKYNASYAWFPSRSVYAGYGWITLNEDKMGDPRFELAYSNSEVRIYKLRSTS